MLPLDPTTARAIILHADDDVAIARAPLTVGRRIDGNVKPSRRVGKRVPGRSRGD